MTAPIDSRASKAARERALHDAGEYHGVPGQLNMIVLDVDSRVTDYGHHNRLLVSRGTGDEHNIMYVREDLRGLPLSTEEDRRRALNHPLQRLHTRGERLRHLDSEQWASKLGETIDHRYEVVRATPAARTSRACGGCGAAMVAQQPGTPEQAYVGTSYACPNANLGGHQCGGSVLVPSPALVADLAAQAGTRRRP